MRYDVSDPVGTILGKLQRRQRGPKPGEGRSHGIPWRGIVEDTPCLWVTWIVDACRRLHLPVVESISIDGRRVPLVWTELTYGRRYYFVAPCCGRRVEALYFLGGEFGCRRCLRLGYESQVYRPSSVWLLLKRVYSREPLSRRWETSDSPVLKALVIPLRQLMEERIEAMLRRVEATGGDGQPQENPALELEKSAPA